MTILEQLHIVFNIRKGEGRTVARILLFSFFQNMGLALLFATANILYLSNVDIDTLPYVYVATAILMLILEFIYERLESFWTVGRIILAILIGLVVSTLGFKFAIDLDAKSSFILFGLIVWERAAALTANSEFGKVNAMIFDIRQSKRLFGLLGSAEIPAKIIGVLLAPILLGFLNITDLLVCSSVFFAISIIFFLRLQKRHPDKLNIIVRRGISKIKASSKRSPAQFIMEFFGSKYVLWLALFTLALVITVVLVEYAFLNKVEASFGNDSNQEKSLAYFFGIFFALGEAVVFIAKTFFSGRMLNRFGLKTALNILPVGLLVLTGGYFVSQLFFEELYLWMIGFMMLFSNISKSSITDPAFFTLFQPLKKELRFEKYNAVGIIENIAYAVAGFALILTSWLGSFSNADPIILFILLLSIALIACIWVVGKIQNAYQDILKKALKNRSLEGASLELRDAHSAEVLVEKLTSPHIGEVLYSLNLLVKFKHGSLKNKIPELLQHPALEVKEEVLRLIERHKMYEFEGVVRQLIASPTTNPRLKSLAINVYTGVASSEFVEEITPYLEDHDQLVKTGAMIGLIRNGGISGVIAAGERLISLVNSLDPKDRKFAAFIVGEIGIQNFYQPLLKLLNDEDEEVVKTALDASGKIKNARLAKEMVSQLGQPHIFETAGRSLIRMGASALPFINEAFENQYDLKMLRRCAYVSGRIGGDQAKGLLKNRIAVQEPEIRNQVLESLDGIGFQATSAEVAKFMQRELQDATYLLLAKETIRKAQMGILLVSALDYEVQQSIHRILILLSFAYSGGAIHSVKENLFLDERERKANAIEMLDVVLPSLLKKQIFPLLEEIPVSLKLERLQVHFPQEQKTAREFVEALISPSCKYVNSWTKSTAIYTLKDYKKWGIDGALVNYLQDPHPIISETASVVLFLLNPKKFAQLSKYMPSREKQIMQKIQETMENQRNQKLFQIEKVLLLKTVSIFKDTSEEILTEIASILEEVELKAGETVFHKGEEGDCMYIIFNGKVKVHDGDNDFAQLGERDFFGELSLLDPEPRSASITAIEDTFLLQLNQNTFYEIMADRIEVVRGIVRILVKRLRDQNELITQLKSPSA